MHQLPTVRQALFDALRTRYGEFQPWLRSTRTHPPGPLAGWREQLKPGVIAALGGRAFHVLAASRGHATNRHLLGVYDFRGGAARYLRLMSRWLAMADEGDLLMCHPAGHRDAGDAIGEARLSEYQVLGGAAFGRLLEQAGVQTWPMSQIVLHRDRPLKASPAGRRP